MPSNNQFVPLDIPKNKQEEFLNNYNLLTKETNNLMLFSCDQKIEHLNDDFYGDNITSQANSPKHIFSIASQIKIGAMATHLGLVARYAQDYSNVINYVVKLNAKTNIIKNSKKEPLSSQLWSVSDVLDFKKETKLPIVGIGFTIYLGSEFENIMLYQAAQAVNSAHKNGLVAILWIYPRSKHIIDEKDTSLITGAAGIANSLGADFVKIQAPKSIEALKIITEAAGNTKVICSGGKLKDSQELLKDIYSQIHFGQTAGTAIGRNIFQRPEKEAIILANSISSIIYGS